jgi:hypothetical protein
MLRVFNTFTTTRDKGKLSRKTVRAASAESTPVDKNPPPGLVETGSKQQNVLRAVPILPENEPFV